MSFNENEIDLGALLAGESSGSSEQEAPSPMGLSFDDAFGAPVKDSSEPLPRPRPPLWGESARAQASPAASSNYPEMPSPSSSATSTSLSLHDEDELKPSKPLLASTKSPSPSFEPPAWADSSFPAGGQVDEQAAPGPRVDFEWTTPRAPYAPESGREGSSALTGGLPPLREEDPRTHAPAVAPTLRARADEIPTPPQPFPAIEPPLQSVVPTASPEPVSAIQAQYGGGDQFSGGRFSSQGAGASGGSTANWGRVGTVPAQTAQQPGRPHAHSRANSIPLDDGFATPTPAMPARSGQGAEKAIVSTLIAALTLALLSGAAWLFWDRIWPTPDNSPAPPSASAEPSSEASAGSEILDKGFVDGLTGLADDTAAREPRFKGDLEKLLGEVEAAQPSRESVVSLIEGLVEVTKKAKPAKSVASPTVILGVEASKTGNEIILLVTTNGPGEVSVSMNINGEMYQFPVQRTETGVAVFVYDKELSPSGAYSYVVTSGQSESSAVRVY